jgi:hypothetical protein
MQHTDREEHHEAELHDNGMNSKCLHLHIVADNNLVLHKQHLPNNNSGLPVSQA